jgi:hypothetical protein
MFKPSNHKNKRENPALNGLLWPMAEEQRQACAGLAGDKPVRQPAHRGVLAFMPGTSMA